MNGEVQTPWIYRRWRFDFPAELFPAVIERLRGLPPRAEEATATLSPQALRHIPEGGWSIKRHLGHLADIEALLNRRLDTYEAGVPLLPPADMGNQRSQEADHDESDVPDLLHNLREIRTATVARLENYPRDFFARSAWHERLGVQKRAVDTCVFFADHDDYHLAKIAFIKDLMADESSG